MSSTIDILCILVKYLIALILLIIAIVLSKDVLDQYRSKATSFNQHEKEIRENESVTIVMEFWPLKKTDYPTSTPFQSYEQWKLGKDFTLTFGVTNYRIAQEVIQLEEQMADSEISHSSIGKVHFDRLTHVYGNCYKISADVRKIKKPYRAFVNIEFDKSIRDEDIPGVDIRMSSEENSYGITMSDWLDGKRLQFIKVKGFFWVEVQPHKVIKMKSNSCSDSAYYECFHSELIKQNYDHCPRKCFSISTMYNATPICETEEEFICSHKVTQKLKDESTCLPACNQINYVLEVEYREDEDLPNARRNITILYKISDTKMKVEEEYLIKDFVGMIGSIGGTLGLCIGFSFLGGTSFLLSHLQDMVQKWMSKMKIDVPKKQMVIEVKPITNSTTY